MKESMLKVLLLFLSLLNIFDASKILVWSPLLGRSHAKFMAKISDVLVTHGHNVTFFQTTFDPDTLPEFDTLAQTIIVHHPNGYDPNILYKFDYKNEQMFLRRENLLWPENIQRLLKISLDQCQGLISDPITSQLQKENYDLIVFELIDLCPGLWIQYLGIEKIIATSSYGTAPIMEFVSGLNALPSYVPFIFSKASDQMTYLERIENILLLSCQRLFLPYNSKALINLSNKNKKYSSTKYKIIDPLKFLSKKISAYFINVNEFTETARPILRNFIDVGGLMVETKQNSLTKDYENIYNSCPKGVVIFSFGSLVQTKNLPKNTKLGFIEAFKKFPNLCFIWKIDRGDDIFLESSAEFFNNNKTNLPENIFIRNWIPQQQLLADDRTKMFITHAGANSINEAFAFGIPVITIPLYLDNFQNSVGAIRREIGVTLDKMSLTQETISNAIKTILENKKFKQKAKENAAQLRKHRRKIVSEIIEWTEKVIEFGPLEHLILVSTELNFIQLYCLDIFLPLFAIIAIFWIAILKFINLIIRIIVNSDTTTTLPPLLLKGKS